MLISRNIEFVITLSLLTSKTNRIFSLASYIIPSKPKDVEPIREPATIIISAVPEIGYIRRAASSRPKM